MRLHRLSLSAFGPFAGREEVDFDALSDGGLFLLHGATGAGKTSVLDAVCFALYGDVPGERKKDHLRSHHARPDTPTEVVLDFTVRGRRLEVTRGPAYEVRRNGRGTTVRARTLLREWKAGATPEWTDLSVSHREIGEELLQLLGGMSREQFCQVVLLPQGDFAKFLRADAKDRAALLGRLFDTGRFSRVERWLADRRLAGEKAARKAVDEALGTLHRLHQAAGSAERPPSADTAASWPGLVESALATAAQLRVDARERADHARLALAAAEERHRRAGEAVEAARLLADRRHRHRRALDRAAELRAAAERAAALAERLDRAGRAAEVLPLWALAQDAADEYRAAAEREAKARAALGGDGTGAGEAELARAEAELRQELVRLEGAAEAEREHSRAAGEREKLRRECEQADAARDDAARWLDGWPAVHRAAAARLRDAEAAATAAAALAEGAAAPP
ncbi:AAA family ATPase, partial [Streptomyces capparidis]